MVGIGGCERGECERHGGEDWLSGSARRKMARPTGAWWSGMEPPKPDSGCRFVGHSGTPLATRGRETVNGVEIGRLCDETEDTAAAA